MKKTIFLLLVPFVWLLSGCDALKGLPTNTTGGLFSLNGSWQLAASSDNRVLEGSVVRVFPGVADATLHTMVSNSFCMRQGDVFWRGLKTNADGSFAMEQLIQACNTATFQPATITVLNNNEIRVATRTASGAEWLQTWRRVTGN